MKAFSEKTVMTVFDILIEILMKHCTEKQIDAIVSELKSTVKTSEFIEESKRRN